MIRLIWIFAPLLMVGCYYDVETDLYPDTSCNTPIEVLYSTHVVPLIAQRCAFSGCHVDGDVSGADLDTYEGVKARVDDGSFADRSLTQRNMPSSAPLPGCEIDLLQAWIDQGAPNN
ncbi:MAG: hypothetical protein ACI84C_000182 [Flavobacteriales bacterium]|jgi:hypothetical protein